VGHGNGYLFRYPPEERVRHMDVDRTTLITIIHHHQLYRTMQFHSTLRRHSMFPCTTSYNLSNITFRCSTSTCMLVQYCNADRLPEESLGDAQKECKQRAAKLRDEALFTKDPPTKEDCPICFLPMSVMLISRVSLPPATMYLPYQLVILRLPMRVSS
jgi:hypothetical protein